MSNEYVVKFETFIIGSCLDYIKLAMERNLHKTNTIWWPCVAVITVKHKFVVSLSCIKLIRKGWLVTINWEREKEKEGGRRERELPTELGRPEPNRTRKTDPTIVFIVDHFTGNGMYKSEALEPLIVSLPSLPSENGRKVVERSREFPR